jgi:hypothetical protein
MSTTTKGRGRALPAILAAAGLAAASLAMAACSDMLPEPAAEAAALGNGHIQISIAGEDTTRSRALMPDIAKNTVNFYEVFFNKGGSWYRYAWYAGQPAVMTNLPVSSSVNYNGTSSNEAFLLAGTNNVGGNTDLTLLAVGVMTNTSDAASGASWNDNLIITASTKRVEFTLFALNAAPSTDPTTTAFKITGPDSPDDYRTDSLPGGDSIPTATVGANTLVPYFKLPKSENNITATYTIPVLAKNKSELSLSRSSFGDAKTLGQALHFTMFLPRTTHGDPGIPLSTGIYSDEGDQGVVLWDTGVNGTRITAADSNLNEGRIGMKFATSGEDGLSMLMIDTMVKGGPDSYTEGVTWHIRPGLNNFLFDRIPTGTTGPTTTINGGILLKIGDSKSGTINISAYP